METQFGRKPPLPSSQSSIFYYKENIVQPCTGADSYQHAGTHLQKATTFSRLPASPGRELQPPALVYQPLLEGSYYPLLSFTSYHWKGATTPSLKASTLSTTMDHVSSIFILEPLHTFKLNIHQTKTYNPINSFIESSTNQPTT